MKKASTALTAIIVIIFGTAMHFVHELPGFNHFWGYVFPVNECVWEHMKMVVWPMILLSVFLCIRSRSIKALGGPVMASLLAIPAQIGLFYMYWPFTHKSVLIFDIILYVAVMILATVFGIKWSGRTRTREHWAFWLIVGLALIFVLGYLTYHPFDMFLFTVA